MNIDKIDLIENQWGPFFYVIFYKIRRNAIIPNIPMDVRRWRFFTTRDQECSTHPCLSELDPRPKAKGSYSYCIGITSFKKPLISAVKICGEAKSTNRTLPNLIG